LKFSKRTWLIILVVAIAAAAYGFYRMDSKPPAQYFTATIERGNIRANVEATGTINAVTTVQVGSQVSGTISRLNADFNTRVKKGQVIAEIDPSIFQGNLSQAKADLENARANLAAARANLEKARSSAIQSRADYQRTVGLAKEGIVSQQQLDLAKATADAADSQVSAMQAGVTQAQAGVSQRAAAVQVAQTNLNHAVITAPIDGTVINRSVDVGQTVAASLQAPTLFTIAQDLTKMQVYTKTDESDIGRIRPGQPVTFKVDAFPNDNFNGRVSQVRMNATTVQNVVTYDTIIDFDNPDLKLFPGMTAYVTIPVGNANNVLRIPNGALRFKPDLKPEEIRALYQKYGIQMPGGRGGDQNAAAEPSNTAAPAENEGGQAGGPPGQSGAGFRAGRGAGGGAASPSTETPGGGTRAARGASSGGAVYAVVWKLLPDKSLQPVRVKTGITDFTNTELVEGDLKEGDQVVTGSSSARSATGAPGLGRAPGGGGPRR
jgi:HlyD family secretion protein